MQRLMGPSRPRKSMLLSSPEAKTIPGGPRGEAPGWSDWGRNIFFDTYEGTLTAANITNVLKIEFVCRLGPEPSRSRSGVLHFGREPCTMGGHKYSACDNPKDSSKPRKPHSASTFGKFSGNRRCSAFCFDLFDLRAARFFFLEAPPHAGTTAS